MPRVLDKCDKKKALQVYKDKLLAEILYYGKRIEDARSKTNKSSSFEEEASSDSDCDLSLVVDTGPSIPQLRDQQAMLKTCLQATQELTNLEVLQSEVNILVQEPVFEGESPINELGTWRQIIADCCVDLVPFNITFFAHCTDDKFAPISYRGLRVMPLKTLHEAELVKSVLPGLKRPSDAVEVLRSYAVAHRSRRSSLARLADKFGAALFMEPLDTGGYQLKCADLLEVSWTLQNKWSPIAPFHHRLKFDVEYMDESYIKTITQAHRQLSDPAVDTDERTLLLAKIISTCLAAKPLEPDTSDQDPASPDKPARRTTLDKEPEVPNMKGKKDSEVMAPPKSLPKKMKPKNKSPSEPKVSDSKPSKRPIQDDKTNENAKKPKIHNNPKEDNSKNIDPKSPPVATHKAKSAANDKSNEHSIASGKINKGKNIANSKSDGDNVKNDAAKAVDLYSRSLIKDAKFNLTKKKSSGKENIENNDEIQANKKDSVSKNEKIKKVVTKSASVKRKSMTNVKSHHEKQINNKMSRNSAPNSNKKTDNDLKKNHKKEKSTKAVKSADSAKKTEMVKEVSKKHGNVIKIVKNITNEKGEVVKKVVKNLANDKPKAVESGDPKANLPHKTKIKKIGSSESIKNTNSAIVEQRKQPLIEQNIKTKTANQNTLKKDTKIPPKVSNLNAKTGITKKISSGNVEKENTAQNNLKSSKIPQKNIGDRKGIVKKMPVRVSPRKSISKTRPLQAGASLKKIVVQKTVTGIPRLLTKSRPKVI